MVASPRFVGPEVSGDALGVRYALTGAVRRAGTALRITAQLVDVRTNEPRWADKYSGTVDGVFDVKTSGSTRLAKRHS
jgi:TolB-like protein